MTDKMNYHGPIQRDAQAIINSRKGVYVRAEGQQLVFTERESCYLYGAIYKLLRVKNEMANLEKAKDDVVDAYNYLALLYEMLDKRFPNKA
jgi:hypothetical protein